SDRFRFILKKKSSPDNKEGKAESPIPPPPKSGARGAPPSEPPAHSSQTLDDLDRKIAQERAEGEAKEELLDKELQGIRTNLEKLELSTASARETHNQTLHFMQQDAEREIKFFERKLQEDMTQWDKQLKDREKS